MASEERKKITLRSSDGEEFVVEEAVAMLSQTIRHMIEDECAESAIPLPNVNSRILTKVIEYCKKHVECTPVASATGDEIAVEEEFWMWDYEFVDVDQSVLFNLMVTQTIRHMIEDECAESAIPLPSVNIGNLAKIIQHCKKHAGCTPVLSEIGEKEAAKKAVEEELRSWDADFVKVDQ